MTRRLGVAVFAILVVASTANADRPRSGLLPSDFEIGELDPATAIVPYNTVYANRCAAGCTVTPGASNSIADSWGISTTRTLTSFPYGDQAWNDVMVCLKDVFSPFKINVVETNPGSANHFEVMIAGLSTDLGMPAEYGGVAPGGCTSTYKNNALVFAFAKTYGSGTSCDATCVNEICATAAQELGHVWASMDHVTTAADPMTYYPYQKRRYFQNMSMQCGSDCVGGIAPSGETCTSSGGTQTQNHGCICTTLDTQNTYTTLKSLFDLGPGSPPTMKILGPKLGENVAPGFSVFMDPTDDSGTIARVDLKVDNVLVGMLTAGPWVINAPTNLMNGTHRVEAIAYDPHQTPCTATVSVVIGPPCEDESDCTTATDVCVGGRCVPGSGVNGGLGTTCANPTDCLSNQCASDGTNSFCVEQCTVGQCPSDFGCLDVGAGDGTGVCWPGYDDGSGCGCQSNGRGGPATLLLLLGVMGLSCRKRRR